MNKLGCWITRRYNGLYLVTAFRPVVCEVKGTGHEDAYIKYGDPVGYINIPYEFAMSVFPNAPQEKVQPHKGVMYGDLGPRTHVVKYDAIDNLYKIYYEEDCYISNICPWFIERMFGPIELRQVHFSGEVK